MFYYDMVVYGGLVVGTVILCCSMTAVMVDSFNEFDIDKMKDTIRDLTDEKTALEEEVESMKEEVKTLKGEVADLKDELEEAEEREEKVRAERARTVKEMRLEFDQKDRAVRDVETQLVGSWACFAATAIFAGLVVFVALVKASPLVATSPCPGRMISPFVTFYP